MVPELTLGWVFKVNTYLWAKLRTVTCLQWGEQTEESSRMTHTHTHCSMMQSCTHCSNCGSFSLMTAQLVSDSSSVGHRPACIIWKRRAENNVNWLNQPRRLNNATMKTSRFGFSFLKLSSCWEQPFDNYHKLLLCTFSNLQFLNVCT